MYHSISEPYMKLCRTFWIWLLKWEEAILPNCLKLPLARSWVRSVFVSFAASLLMASVFVLPTSAAEATLDHAHAAAASMRDAFLRRWKFVFMDSHSARARFFRLCALCCRGRRARNTISCSTSTCSRLMQKMRWLWLLLLFWDVSFSRNIFISSFKREIWLPSSFFFALTFY